MPNIGWQSDLYGKNNLNMSENSISIYLKHSFDPIHKEHREQWPNQMWEGKSVILQFAAPYRGFLSAIKAGPGQKPVCLTEAWANNINMKLLVSRRKKTRKCLHIHIKHRRLVKRVQWWILLKWKKSRIWKTPTLSTDADSRTNTKFEEVPWFIFFFLIFFFNMLRY